MTAAEVMRVAQISDGYIDMAVSLRRDAFLARIKGAKDTANAIEEMERFVRRAARAEEHDPEIEEK